MTSLKLFIKVHNGADFHEEVEEKVSWNLIRGIGLTVEIPVLELSYINAVGIRIREDL
jgi:hypothetical protein